VGEVLKRVDQSLNELEGMIDRAAAEHADVIALPATTGAGPAITAQTAATGANTRTVHSQQ